MAKQLMDLHRDGNYPPTTHTPRYTPGANSFHNNLYKPPSNYNTNSGNIMTKSGINVYGANPYSRDLRNNSTPLILPVTYE